MTTTDEPTKKSSLARVKAHKQRLLAAGGKKIYVSLSPETVKATEALVSSGYEKSATAVINKALLAIAADLPKNT